MNAMNMKIKHIKEKRLNHLFFTPLEELLKTPEHELHNKKEYARLLVNYLNNVIAIKQSIEMKL
jgi:hypothetical protein